MNGFGNEIAKAAGRALGYAAFILVLVVIAAFALGRYSA